MQHKKWTDVIEDSQELAVFVALDESQFDLKTIDDISKATSIPPTEVERIIHKYQNIIRKSSTSTINGKNLYVLAGKPKNLAETIESGKVPTSKSIGTKRKH